MSSEHIRYLHQYFGNIAAASRNDALILGAYLEGSIMSGYIYEIHEILDIEHYKVIRKPKRLAKIVKRPEEKNRFKFLVCRN